MTTLYKMLSSVTGTGVGGSGSAGDLVAKNGGSEADGGAVTGAPPSVSPPPSGSPLGAKPSILGLGALPAGALPAVISLAGSPFGRPGTADGSPSMPFGLTGTSIGRTIGFTPAVPGVFPAGVRGMANVAVPASGEPAAGEAMFPVSPRIWSRTAAASGEFGTRIFPDAGAARDAGAAGDAGVVGDAVAPTGAGAGLAAGLIAGLTAGFGAGFGAWAEAAVPSDSAKPAIQNE